MIDKRELLEKARERNLSLQMIEKDYVLGWLLFGVSRVPNLVFKGGTALSKIYFPKIWRLSEDLDFSFTGEDLKSMLKPLEDALSHAEHSSGIKFKIKSYYSNPLYLQLKIQYDALLGRNWAKLDLTKEEILDNTRQLSLKQVFSDYPRLKITVESLEEIFAEKLRALLERNKCRDYYDVWQLLKLRPRSSNVRNLFLRKCRLKNIDFNGPDQFFPSGLEEILDPYWERELGRLTHPLPDLHRALRDLKQGLNFLGK